MQRGKPKPSKENRANCKLVAKGPCHTLFQAMVLRLTPTTPVRANIWAFLEMKLLLLFFYLSRPVFITIETEF